MFIEREIPRVLVLDSNRDGKMAIGLERELGFEIYTPSIHEEDFLNKFAPHIAVIQLRGLDRNEIPSRHLDPIKEHNIPVIVCSDKDEFSCLSVLELPPEQVASFVTMRELGNGVAPARRLQAVVSNVLGGTERFPHVDQLSTTTVPIDETVTAFLSKNKVRIDNTAIGGVYHLSYINRILFNALNSKRGDIVTYGELFDKLGWSDNQTSRANLYIHIHRISALMRDPHNAIKTHIATVSDKGYALRSKDEIERFYIRHNPVVIGNWKLDFETGIVENGDSPIQISQEMLLHFFVLVHANSPISPIGFETRATQGRSMSHSAAINKLGRIIKLLGNDSHLLVKDQDGKYSLQYSLID